MALSKQEQHKIRVKIETDANGKTRHAILEIPKSGLHVGQTVSYFGDDSFSLEFPDGSLFGVTGKKIVSSSEPLKLVKVGKFECRCSITPKVGLPIHWGPSDPKSGGAHDVQPL